MAGKIPCHICWPMNLVTVVAHPAFAEYIFIFYYYVLRKQNKKVKTLNLKNWLNLKKRWHKHISTEWKIQ